MRETHDLPVRIEYTVRIGPGRRGRVVKGTADLVWPIPVETTVASVNDEGEAIMDYTPIPDAAERDMDERITAMLVAFAAPTKEGKHRA